jgi:hypothetical protein
MIAPIVPLPALVLRLRLWLASRGPVASGAAVLCVAAVLTLAWLLPERALQRQRSTVALGLANLPQPAAIAPLATANSDSNATANANLALFYDMLGERRYAEQQVKTLFALASKAGLVLSQGEYKGTLDRNGRFHTYQVNLPVKGGYGAIWQFAMFSLRAIPFASLDEISFRRESIGETMVEAHVRITLYLTDQAPGALP